MHSHPLHEYACICIYTAIPKVELLDFAAARAMVFPEGDYTLVERQKQAEAEAGDGEEKPRPRAPMLNPDMIRFLMQVSSTPATNIVLRNCLLSCASATYFVGQCRWIVHRVGVECEVMCCTVVVLL